MQQLDQLGLNLKIDSNGIPSIESAFSPNIKATLRLASQLCLEGNHLEGIKLLTECCKDEKYKKLGRKLNHTMDGIFSHRKYKDDKSYGSMESNHKSTR